MSIKEQKADKFLSKRSTNGVKDIPATLRRGLRMNNTQRRFALTISTVLVLALIFIILFASGQANNTVVANEKAQILQEVIGAERIEMGKKTIEMTQEHGTKYIDGKRVVMLQKIGQQKAGNAKTYWLTACTEAEAAEYETGLGKDKKLIQLDSRGDLGLYITLAKDTEVEKCLKAYDKAFFFQLSNKNGAANLEGIPAEYRETMSAAALFCWFILALVEIILHIRSGNLKAVSCLEYSAAALFAYGLKSTKLAQKGESARRTVTLVAAVLALILTVGLVYTTVQVSTLGDKQIRTGELTIDSDVARGIESNPEADNSGKYVYTAGSGKTALLALLVFALLYFFRYERDLGFPVFNTVLLILLMFITLYPVLNTVAYSFNDGTDAARGGIGLLPRKFSTKSYERILNDPDIWQAALISVSKTIITTVLNLFWTGMLSFALSRREYVLRKFITLTMVLTMYVNAGLIPSYLLISQTLHLRNTFWVYIIPTMFSCFNMIIIRTYIMGLPDALVESARIDGAGDFRIYWQIIFPLCMPVLATVALFVAVGAWNSWFDTMLYIPTERKLDTLQYYLKGKLATAGQTSNLANSTVDAATANAAFSVTQRTVQCATTVVTALPILVVYPFLQKYFVTGMALGSVKG